MEVKPEVMREARIEFQMYVHYETKICVIGGPDSGPNKDCQDNVCDKNGPDRIMQLDCFTNDCNLGNIPFNTEQTHYPRNRWVHFDVQFNLLELRDRKKSMVRYAKWQRILQLNQAKLERFFGERTRRSISFDHKGPFFLTKIQTQMKQSELELISPPDYTYCIILLIIDFLLLLNVLRLQNFLCGSQLDY